MTKLFIIFSLLLCYSTMAQGRGPAIEPGRGLTIDHYDHSNNKKDPGFNWKQSNKGRNLEATSPKNYRRKVSSTNEGSFLANILMTAAVIIIPIFLWFTVLRKLGETEEKSSNTVVSLDNYRKDPTSTDDNNNDHDDHDDHKDHYPKAS